MNPPPPGLHRHPLALAAAAACLLAGGCATADRNHRLVVSVPDQRMLVIHRGTPVAEYPVSTSKFGLGDRPGSNATPLGEMEVARKFGHHQPAGTVFKHRRPTPEIVAPNSPGRDPIVTRILWLRGLEPQNRNAFGRYIYIHGTPEESRIGSPASFGCIRMRSRDVQELFDRVGIGARVEVTLDPIATVRPAPKGAPPTDPVATSGNTPVDTGDTNDQAVGG